jgi:vomeronasal1 receptor
MFRWLTGNSLLFILYTYTFLTESHLKKPINAILAIMFKFIADVTLLLEGRYFLDDVACKAFWYTYRVTQGLSVCTEMLSAFQAITVSPTNSKWPWLKSKLSSWIASSFIFFWIPNLLTYMQNILVFFLILLFIQLHFLLLVL